MRVETGHNVFHCSMGVSMKAREIRNKKPGQANPAEFPWTCLVLDQNNNFVGSCAIIPDNQFNDVRSGTDRVILAAHKLKNIRNPR